MGTLPQGAHKTFAEITKGSSSSWDPNVLAFPSIFFDALDGKAKCDYVKNVGTKEGKDAFFLSGEDTTKLAANYKFTLVGKFPLGHPKLDYLRKVFDGLQLIGSCKIDEMDGRHVSIQLFNEEDYTRVFAKKFFNFGKQTMKVLKWAPYFDPDSEPPITPVWFKFPGLKLHLFNHEVLFSLANSLGRPMRLDEATYKMTRPYQARVLVERNITLPPPEDIWIGSEHEGYWQKIEQEYQPIYCGVCKMFGHSEKDCYRLKPRVRKLPSNDTRPPLLPTPIPPPHASTNDLTPFPTPQNPNSTQPNPPTPNPPIPLSTPPPPPPPPPPTFRPPPSTTKPPPSSPPPPSSTLPFITTSPQNSPSPTEKDFSSTQSSPTQILNPKYYDEPIIIVSLPDSEPSTPPNPIAIEGVQAHPSSAFNQVSAGMVGDRNQPSPTSFLQPKFQPLGGTVSDQPREVNAVNCSPGLKKIVSKECQHEASKISASFSPHIECILTPEAEKSAAVFLGCNTTVGFGQPGGQPHADRNEPTSSRVPSRSTSDVNPLSCDGLLEEIQLEMEEEWHSPNSKKKKLAKAKEARSEARKRMHSKDVRQKLNLSPRWTRSKGGSYYD